MTPEELYEYLINKKHYTPESAWEYVRSGKPAPTLPTEPIKTNFIDKFITNIKDTDKPFIGGNLDLSNLEGLGTALRNKKIIEGGPTIAQSANTLSGLYQGGTALKGLYDNMNLDEDLGSLKEDVNLAIASNPMYDTYLDAEDEKTIRQMNNGTLENNWGNAVSGAIQGLPKAAISAMLGGLTGGVGGAAIGGLGSLANSAISGYGKGTEEASNKLQSLYSKLKQSNEEYRSMKRPAGLHRAGLQTKYFNQLY